MSTSIARLDDTFIVIGFEWVFWDGNMRLQTLKSHQDVLVAIFFSRKARSLTMRFIEYLESAYFQNARSADSRRVK